MKNNLFRRLLSVLLLAAMLIGIFPAALTVQAQETDVAVPEQVQEERPTGRAASASTLKTNINALSYPLAQPLENAPSNYKNNFSGVYLIVSTSAKSDGTNNYTLNPSAPKEEDTGSNGYNNYVGYDTEQATARDSEEDIANNKKYFYGKKRGSFSLISGTPSDFSIQTVDGKYWNVEDITQSTTWAGLRLRDALNANRFSVGVCSGRYHEIKHTSTGWYLNSNSATFRMKKVAGDGNQKYFWFCRVCDELFYLHEALQFAKSYLTGNTSGAYDAEKYEAFLTTVENAYNFYVTHKETLYTKITAATKTSADEHTDAIYDAVGKLILSDSSKAYIDIPVEVLDFRADSFMFESKYTFGSPYSLSQNSPVITLPDGSQFKRPGNFEYSEENSNGEDYNYYIEGLIEDELYYDEARDQKRVVYKVETISYIAAALFIGKDKVDPAEYDAHWNKVFYDKVFPTDSTKKLELGSWVRTLDKLEGAVNGGLLKFSQVETCYDMAYYLLTNIWSRVPDNDVLGQETTNTGTKNMRYNMAVPELKKLRLTANGDGTYSFKSNKASSYDADEGIIYSGGTDGSGHPAFNIVRNLGFEHSDYFGNNSTGINEELTSTTGFKLDRNYYYTLHAHSAFVYYEEANLQFQFVGDDDVYFFVNDHLICDIGGIHGSPQRTEYLNSWAETLGLKEGDICTFDMFFGDRHLDGINLHFTTNIVMMDESVITVKEQYEPESGAPIPDGTSFLSGTPIGYGFTMQNRREFGVQNLSFKDTSLGVTVSYEDVTLNGKANVGDLTLIYQTYDPETETVHDTPTSAVTYSTFQTTLTEAVTNPTTTVNPLAAGTYTLTGLTAAQIKSLLSIGLPAHTKLTISGLKHTIAEGTYTNTVETSCIPRDISGNLGNAINGSASRTVRGLVLADEISATPAQIVVDYSKPVEFYPQELERNISYDETKYTLKFVGLKTSGSNGAASTTEPKNTTLKADGQSVSGNNGTYSRHGDYIRFQMTNILSEIERSYLVFSVSQSGTVAHYLMLELQIVPANEMYYETDFADDVFNIEQSDSHLFFDFTDTEADRERYDTRLYAYTNYDIGSWSVNRFRCTNPVYDSTAGTMSVGLKNLLDEELAGSNYYDSAIYYFQLGEKFMNNHYLNYNPANTEVIMIRLKLNGVYHYAHPTETTTPKMRLTFSYFTDTSGSEPIWASGVDVPESAVTSGEYVTYVFDSFTSNFLNAEHINNFRFNFSNLRLNDPNVPGEILVDYIYLGPKNEAPENPEESLPQKDSVWFDFTDTRADRARYDSADYAGVNYDIGGWCNASNRMGSNVFDADNGVLTSELKCVTDSNSYYFQTSAELQRNFYMGYDPAKAEVAELRFKIENVERTGSANPMVQLNYFQTLNDKNGKYATATDKALVGLMEPFTIADEYLSSGEYLTVTVPVREAFNEVDHVTAFRIHFGYMRAPSGQTGKLTIDYFFVGTKADLAAFHESRSDFSVETIGTSQEELQDLSYGNEAIVLPEKLSEDYLLFSFDNNAASKTRYDKAAYGGNENGVLTDDPNHDDVWSYGSGTPLRNQNPDFSKGTMHYELVSTAPNYGYWFDCPKKLNYQPGQTDYLYSRIKLTGSVATNSDGMAGFKVYFYNTASSFISGTTHSTTFSVEEASNGYVDVRIPLTNSAYLNAAAVGGIRIELSAFTPATGAVGSFDIDYIFIGSVADAKQVIGKQVYMGFANSVTDQLRYRDNLAFGGISRDASEAWSANTHFAPPVVSEEEGTLSVQSNDASYKGAYIQLGKAVNSGWTMQLDSCECEVLQIRFKLENYVAAASTTSFRAFHFVTSARKDTADANGNAVELLNDSCGDVNGDGTDDDRLYYDITQASEDYVILTMPLNDLFRASMVKQIEHTEDNDYITSIRLQWNDIISKSATEYGKIIIDYVYIGSKEDAPVQTTYGYDTSYTDDSRHSNGSTFSIEGMGVPLMKKDKDTEAVSIDYDGTAAYSEASFTFKGTGFDLISQTGKDQGALRVVILKADGTYYKTISVSNKQDNDRNLYQIPVVSAELPYDTYQVKIFVNAAYDYGNDGDIDSFQGRIDRGGEFRFDAVRIYDPLGKNVAESSYQTHYEAYPVFEEVRQKLIDATNFNAGGSMDGALYIEKGDAKVDIATYTLLGPNNETYLATDQAIAFKVIADGAIPKSFDIGVKSADGKPANLTVTVTSSYPNVKPSKQDRTITSCTALYYPIDVSATVWGSSKSVYVTVYNSGGSGILSLTDFKCTYAAPTQTTAAEATATAQSVESNQNSRSMRFVVDGELLAMLKNTPVLDENLRANSAITVGAEMSVGYSFMAQTLADYESFYLEVSKTVAGAEPIITVFEMEDFDVALNPTTGEAMMYSTVYRGISAKEMGDEFSTTLYALGGNGRLYKGETVTTSIKDYLVSNANEENATDSFKTMAVDMLKYGAQAQNIFDYGTDNLVTAELSEELLSYATVETPEATDISTSNGDGVAITANVTVGSKVELGLSIFKAGLSAPDTVRCEIRDAEGNLIAEPTVANAMNMMFSAGYSEVGAREMRKPITATFFMGDEQISQTITWSVESYVAQVRANSNSTENDIAMVNAMLTYGDSVGAYLTSIGQ